MLPGCNFNPFVVETILPRNGGKAGEINELKPDLRGEVYAGGSNGYEETATTTMRGVGHENA